jgi:hypothetical protein
MRRLASFVLALAGSFFGLFSVIGLVQPPDENRWYVYRDADSRENHGVWSNWMPAEAARMLKVNMVDAKDPNSGATCIRVDVRWQPPFWAGIAVACESDYWGQRPSATAFNLRKAKKLVFHARGELGGETIQAKVAIAGDKPFGDSAKTPAATEWITLTKSWKRYELDLTGMDLARVVTPFAWVANKDYNPRDFTFYLDDIYFVLE